MQITSKTGKKIYMPTDQEDTEINKGIASDPDTYELTEAEFAKLKPAKVGRPRAEVSKMPVSIRLSPEVVKYFKATGKGWQTRMDEVLKDYVSHH